MPVPLKNLFSDLAKRAFLGRASRTVSVDPETSIIIFSSGRGGSTWINEVLRCIPDTATVWEPLAVNQKSPFVDIGINWDQYIPEDAVWPEAKSEFEKLFYGKSLSWPNTEFERNRGGLAAFSSAERLIFKFVKANALGPWLLTNFCFTAMPVFLLRHPMPTIASRITHGAWNDDGKTYNFAKTRFPKLLDQHRDYLVSLNNSYSVLTAKWCMQNLPLIDAARDRRFNLHTVFYEDVVLHREDELNKLFAAIDVAAPPQAIQISKNASVTTRAGSPITGIDQLSFWREKVEERDIQNMQTVLDHFGIDFYVGNSDLPQHNIFFR